MPSGFRQQFEISYDLVPEEGRKYPSNKIRPIKIEFSYDVYRQLNKDRELSHPEHDYVVVNLTKEEAFSLAYQLMAFANEVK